METIRSLLLTASAVACLSLPAPVWASFGLTSSSNAYTVDTGAGLVFKVRRTDNGSHTQSPGDIMSMVYNGVEYQDQSRGSQINSGFDWLGYSNSNVHVTAQRVGSDVIKITVTTADLVHYYMARKGDPYIYMATCFDVEPVTGGGLCRYIVRIPYDKLPNGPAPSDNHGTTVTVESGDIFGLPNGETRSKHYSNHRLIDWTYTGATGNGVGIFMVRDSQEGGSGGPFYRSLINQGGGDQEITYILNYGEAQTEAFRTSILNGPYILVFTDGHRPPEHIDTSWIDSAGLNLTGWVPQADRGTVTGTVTGIPVGFEAVVGFVNVHAQYWARADANGIYTTRPMIPGTYTATLYKQELGVATKTVTVHAGADEVLDIASTESSPDFIWRLGDWDGTPAGFLNADKVTTMHPSDVRMADWNLGTFVVGSSTPATGIPCYQWKGIAGGSQAIQFKLTGNQVVNSTVRIGITVAYANGRPYIQVNSWKPSSYPSPSSQPSTRSLTVGTYRGNNTTYTFHVPASALHSGTNTLTISPISGSGYPTGFLSAGYSLDCIEWDGPVESTPTPPTGLTATSGNGQVTLRWNPCPAAKSYTVERATLSSGPYTTLATDVGPARFTDTAVTPGILYFYRVTAINGVHTRGTSNSSATIAVTPGSLWAHWTFDETSGTTATDIAGDHDATLAASASWTSGLIEHAVNLNGNSDSYVTLPSGIVHDLNDFTIATWVRPTSLPSWSRIFDFGTGTDRYMYLTPASAGGRDDKIRYAITLGSSNGEESIRTGDSLSLGTWHHVAVTQSGSLGTLYIEGQAVATNNAMSLTPADLGLTRYDYLGKSQWPDPYPTLKMDDFRIYSRALDSSEIAALNLAEPPQAPTHLHATANGQVVTLTWNASVGAARYNIKSAESPGGPYKTLAGGITGSEFAYPSPSSGTLYYVVSAVSAFGEGNDSAEASVTIDEVRFSQAALSPAQFLLSPAQN